MAAQARWWLICPSVGFSLLLIHIGLCRIWYGLDWRGKFTKKVNVHMNDLILAVRVAEGNVLDHGNGVGAIGEGRQLPRSVGGVAVKRLALLYMLRRELEHRELWRKWLEQDGGKQFGISLYFHLADRSPAQPDSRIDAEINQLRSLPGFRQVVPTAATSWCELIAAQVSLVRAALADDESNTYFVFLPHDAMPLAPQQLTLTTLLLPGGGTPMTRICPAGVRGLDVPYDCPHAIEPHWGRSLLLKHHQWLALDRNHAQRFTNPNALRVAVRFFNMWFLGQPLCSDEIFPLLALALPTSWVDLATSHSDNRLEDLPLIRSASTGLGAFEQGLAERGISCQCILYAPWVGCHLHASEMGAGKRQKSPVIGGGLTSDDQRQLVRDIGKQGVLFGRKLGGAVGNITEYLSWIEAVREQSDLTGTLPSAPPRLMPDTDLRRNGSALFTLIRWWLQTVLATLGAYLSTFQLIGLLAGLAGACCYIAVFGGLPRNWMACLLLICFVAHFVVFLLSIVLHPEYSLLEPFKGSAKDEHFEI